MLKEDFYYCESDWIPKNTHRVFRLNDIKTDDEDDTVYFYPMVDRVYIKNNEHTDMNGDVCVYNDFSNFRLADYSEVNKYIKDVYESFSNSSYVNSFKLHKNNRKLRKLWESMLKSFDKRNIFVNLTGEIENFHRNDIYNESDRILLNLLRSYYKCRILKK